MAKRKRAAYTWDARSVLALRQHMDLTQAQLADELGVRQQTVSEWETGAYKPRGASGRLLSIVAERAGWAYRAAKVEAGLRKPEAAGGEREAGSGKPEAGG